MANVQLEEVDVSKHPTGGYCVLCDCVLVLECDDIRTFCDSVMACEYDVHLNCLDNRELVVRFNTEANRYYYGNN